MSLRPSVAGEHAPAESRSGSTAEVAALVRRYYNALEQGEALDGFYATDAEAGELAPVVKIGSGRGEVFLGHEAVAAAVRQVVATLTGNRLQSRRLIVSGRGDLRWFVDEVWWSGQAGAQPFASLTRWTGLCLRCPSGWKLLQLHVSEEAD
ncbi:MAG TPA: nuclear transport factor 2 family protein [Chloroflexota bacterium]|nr:nuclear transport factor 2 family protein [Chloroflexota bacterium]